VTHPDAAGAVGLGHPVGQDGISPATLHDAGTQSDALATHQRPHGRALLALALASAPLCALSINLHAGWIQGLGTLAIITGAIGMMEMGCRWGGRPAASHLLLGRPLLILAACGLALLLNPYGPELLVFPFTMQRGWIRAMNGAFQGEWSPAWTPAPWRMEGGFVIPARWLFCGYLGLMVVVLVASLRRWRTVDLVPVAVLALWLAHSARHARAAADAMLMTDPFVAAALSAWWSPERRAVRFGSVATLGLTAVALYGATVTWFASQVGGWRWDLLAPRCVDAVVERLPQPRRLFANEHWLVYRFHPDLTLDYFWEYAVGYDHTWERIAAWQLAPAGIISYLAKYRANLIVLENFYGWLAPGLEAWGWLIIHMDDRYFVMVPQAEASPGTVYRHIRSWGPPAPVHPYESFPGHVY
jgi:hypothetical protein